MIAQMIDGMYQGALQEVGGEITEANIGQIMGMLEKSLSMYGVSASNAEGAALLEALRGVGDNQEFKN